MSHRLSPEFDFSLLSIAARLELAEELLASIRTETVADRFTPEEIEQMHLEMAAIKDGSVIASDWQTVCDRLLKR